MNNLRDGLPYPYTEQDAEDFIRTMLSADKDSTFAFAITLDDKVTGSIGVFRQDNHYQPALQETGAFEKGVVHRG